MQGLIDLKRYRLDRQESPEWSDLVDDCRCQLLENGLFNLPGFLPSAAAVEEVKPVLASNAFTHARDHNIYFKKSVDGLSADHPALKTFRTVNHTICADQIPGSILLQLYEWPPFAQFLAAVMGKDKLHCMADPLARVNVMSYGDGEALNWHFDRSEFTTTLLLQAPAGGGIFEYVKDLRSAGEPNHDGVARLINGEIKPRQLQLEAGTLNVFCGKNTAHRVTPVSGDVARIIAVFSFFETPGVLFSKEERIGFYGRAS